MRLELEKKLAASSQKFADAARLSGELKALAAKLEASRASHAGLSAQVEGERRAQEAEAQREAELEIELKSEQRELDERRFELLAERARYACCCLRPSACRAAEA